MSETVDYLLRRAEEEQAAAREAGNPAVSLIHLELEQRYRKLLPDGPDARDIPPGADG